MTDIFQQAIPSDMTAARALPGVAPLSSACWLQVDDAFAAQMAERARLIATKPDAVLAALPCAGLAVAELMDHVLSWLATHGAGYEVGADAVCRPDGLRVTLDRSSPRAMLATLGHLVQEDLCLLEKDDRTGEHVLNAAVLCFPASWRLSDKVGRPLSVIHVPVSSYDENIARRVQRLFDGVQPGRPLWRFNRLKYGTPDLHQPVPRAQPDDGAALGYLRAERQSVLRLPQSQACVFSIHTYVVRAAD